jgi:hypothetical protein
MLSELDDRPKPLGAVIYVNVLMKHLVPAPPSSDSSATSLSRNPTILAAHLPVVDKARV